MCRVSCGCVCVCIGVPLMSVCVCVCWCGCVVEFEGRFVEEECTLITEKFSFIEFLLGTSWNVPHGDSKYDL